MQMSHRESLPGSRKSSITNLLSQVEVAPRIEQGEVLGKTHQLAMVIEEYGVDLGKFIADGVDVSEQVWLDVSNQIMHLILRVARRGIFHGDIKPGNIVIRSKNGKLSVRFIDFDPKYMSTFEKDENLLFELGGERTQLCALYAVSMLALLHIHFGRMSQIYLYKHTRMFLGLFTMFLPETMGMHESKFGRVLVRHLKHYKLCPSTKPSSEPHHHADERGSLLVGFWELLKRKGVRTQGSHRDVPIYDGKRQFIITEHARMVSPPPHLSSLMRTLVTTITTTEEARHREHMRIAKEERVAATHVGRMQRDGDTPSI
jgi:serine/threonine protein kinase